MWPIDYTQEYEDWFSLQAEDLIDKYPEILGGKNAWRNKNDGI